MSEVQETAPTPKEIDALIREFAAAQSEAAALGATAKVLNEKAGEIKVRLTAMVEQFGVRHTEKSKRLAGEHNTATTTTATRVAIDDEAVERFRAYLGKSELPELSGKFFREVISYSIVAAPAEVLKTLTLGARIRTKITALLGLCFQIKTNNPSLKVDVVEPARP